MRDEIAIQIEVFETLIEAYNMQMKACSNAAWKLVDNRSKEFYRNKNMQLELERDGYQLSLDKLKAKQNDF